MGCPYREIKLGPLWLENELLSPEEEYDGYLFLLAPSYEYTVGRSLEPIIGCNKGVLTLSSKAWIQNAS